MDEKARTDLEKIFSAGLGAVGPESAVKRNVRLTGRKLQVGEKTYSLDDFQRIFVTGVGKGTAPMAKALEDILGDHLTAGWIIVKYDHGLPLGKIRVFEAAHPVPDNAGLEAARFVLQRLAECTEKDLVICAFSGGGSALFPSVRPPLTFEGKQKITRLLLECGATINEINCIRKHMSLGKGGQLAKIAYPATVISLFLSDVVGDPLDVIASGPTVPDTSTFADCLGIVERFGIADRVPPDVFRFFKDGAEGLLEETPKAGDIVFQRNQNLVVGSNRAALLAAEEQAVQLGYNTRILSSFIEGEAREVAAIMAAIGKEIIESGHPLPPPACILAGGETTVTIHGQGKGGRNQELALAAAIAAKGWPRITILSAGTDGSDGPTDAAGAFADGNTFRDAVQLGLNPRSYLLNNDSYNFFDKLGQLFRTGPTRTNVMDVICLLVR
jgi:hydroxypyruvate reductase